MEEVLAIADPIGVGKASLSMELTRACYGEVVSEDSMQVYKEVGIGTAKITKEEIQEVPHYLIGFCSFTEEYSVKIFQEKIREYIAEITEHGHLPIMCGGAGLYIKFYLCDYQFIDQPQDTEFMNFLAERSTDRIWGMLPVIDPKTCENLRPHNKQRIVHALAMAHTGEKKDEIVESQEHHPVYDAYVMDLTVDRSRLYEKIGARVSTMMEQGLLRKVEQLHTLQGDVWSLRSFQGIGYKEWKAYIKDRELIDTYVERIKKDSRDFVKRQYTWFRSQMQVHWYDVEDENYHEKILEDVKAWIENRDGNTLTENGASDWRKQSGNIKAFYCHGCRCRRCWLLYCGGTDKKWSRNPDSC